MLCGGGFVVFGDGYVVFGDGYVVFGDGFVAFDDGFVAFGGGFVACRDVQLHVFTCNPLSRPQPVIPSATRYPVRNPSGCEKT